MCCLCSSSLGCGEADEQGEADEDGQCRAHWWEGQCQEVCTDDLMPSKLL